MDSSQRRLPHIYAIGQPLFVTFRLFGSLPTGREFPKESMTSGEAFVAMDRLLDTARFGPVHLKRPEVAGLVRDSILHCARADCDLHAWVIMANHVHLLLTPHTDVSEFMRRLKGYSARQANRLLVRTGQPFWQDESYDHLVRNGEEFRRIEGYIVSNPVKAGLAASAEEYPWSSIARGGSGDPPQVWTPAPH
jgi:REP element-mobilizing transposase RayT